MLDVIFEYHIGKTGVYFAKCPTDRGLLVMARSFEELKEKVIPVALDLRAARGEPDEIIHPVWQKTENGDWPEFSE